MSEDNAYTDIYDNYDKAVVDFVRTNLRWPQGPTGKNLVTVFATPERAFAQVWKRLHPSSDSKLTVQKTAPLPFGTVNRISEPYDPKRDRKGVFRKWCESADGLTYYNMRWPRPVNLLYEITLWTRNLRDLDSLANQLYEQFTEAGPRTYLTVDHPPVLGEKIIHTTITDDRRLPLVEASDKQRTLRRVITLQLEGWISRETTTTGIVETVITSIEEDTGGDFDEDDLIVLEEITVTEAD